MTSEANETLEVEVGDNKSDEEQILEERGVGRGKDPLRSLSLTQIHLDPTNKFSCVTNDCNSSKLKCVKSGVTSSTTLTEFTLNDVGGLDFFDVSLVNDYNVSMLVVSQGDSSDKCTTTRCVEDLNDT
ncbi:hypothetical protein CR513_51067, partial [Mucuna pruriens]